jgi:hypothetical protein
MIRRRQPYRGRYLRAPAPTPWSPSQILRYTLADTAPRMNRESHATIGTLECTNTNQANSKTIRKFWPSCCRGLDGDYWVMVTVKLAACCVPPMPSRSKMERFVPKRLRCRPAKQPISKVNVTEFPEFVPRRHGTAPCFRIVPHHKRVCGVYRHSSTRVPVPSTVDPLRNCTVPVGVTNCETRELLSLVMYA